jgi:hypothetical protein
MRTLSKKLTKMPNQTKLLKGRHLAKGVVSYSCPPCASCPYDPTTGSYYNTLVTSGS